jgi:hypothetical protein
MYWCSITALWAVVFGSVQGVVHDPNHRPVMGATVLLKSTSSDYSQALTTSADGTFEATSIPTGVYRVSIVQEGFAAAAQTVTVTSASAPVLHF